MTTTENVRPASKPAGTQAEKPADAKLVKDQFLDDLIAAFGSEKGVALWQTGKVTAEDLAAFIALLEKFDPEKRILPRRR